MSTEPLVTSKSPLLGYASTSLPGVVAEEVLESTVEYAPEQDPEQGEDELGPYGGYLLPRAQLAAVLIPIYFLVFLASLDATILSTLMTDIASDLNGIPYISWIVTAYLLSTSIVQPLGKLSDIFGRKPSFLLCIAVFTIGCLQCATANSVASFTSGRFLSGFAAGLNSLSSITSSDLVPLRARGVFQGLGNIFFATGSAVGGIAGGWIAQNWGWRMAFWCQVPIGVACFAIIYFTLNLPVLPHEVALKDVSLSDKLKKIDTYGILLVAFNLLIFIILTSSELNNVQFFSLIAILMGGVYTLWQVEAKHEYAIIPIELMTNRSVLGSALANWFGTMYSYVLMYYFPVYLTTVRGLATGDVGIRSVPNIVIGSCASIGSGFYMKWTGKYKAFSIFVQVIGTLGLVHLLMETRPGHSILFIEEYFLTTMPMFAYASMLTVTLLSLIAAVPVEYQSSVTSLQYAFRSMGSTLGTSFSSYLFTSSLESKLNSSLTAAKPEDVSTKVLQKVIDAALHDARYIRSPEAPKWAVEPMIGSYAFSCWSSYCFSLFGCIACLVCICMIKENKLHTSVNRK